MRLLSRVLAGKLITVSLRTHSGRLTWDQLLDLLGQKKITAEDWAVLAQHLPGEVTVDCVPGQYITARWKQEEQAAVSNAMQRVEAAERVFRVWAGLANQDWRDASANDLRHITDRLKEGWSEEDLIRVAGAAWSSAWHVRHGQTTVHAIYRNADRVTEHLSRAKARSTSVEELDRARQATIRRRETGE